MLGSDWLILLKTPWLDWMIFISARLNSISILIFFLVKNNWLISLLFLFTFILFFEATQLTLSKNLVHMKSPI